MVQILARREQQSTETIDYPISFERWFQNRSDQPSTFTAEATSGIDLVASALVGQVVWVVLSGGTPGQTYKVTVRLTTDAGVPITKEADILVRIKDV